VPQTVLLLIHQAEYCGLGYAGKAVAGPRRGLGGLEGAAIQHGPLISQQDAIYLFYVAVYDSGKNLWKFWVRENC